MKSDTLDVKFYFFRVTHAKDSPELQDVLKKIYSLPFAERKIDIEGIPRYLAGMKERQDGAVSYLFTTKRMAGIPQKANENGERESLGLKENEGLCEDVTLACDAEGKVATILFNRHSMSANCIAAYVNKLQKQYSLQFTPIITKDSLEKILQAHEIKKFSFKIANSIELEALKNFGMSTKDKMALQAMLQKAPYINLELSVGRKKEALSDTIPLIRSLKQYYEMNAGVDIYALKAEIKPQEDAPKETIDLLGDRVVWQGSAPLNTKKEIDGETLMLTAFDALEDKKHEYSRCRELE